MYKIVTLGKGYTGWNKYNIGKKFSSIEEAVEYINIIKKSSSVNFDKLHCIFIVDKHNQVFATLTCLGWQYK